MADLLYWIWLNTVVTPGTETFALLHAAFSSPEEIYRADEAALRAVLTGRHAAAVSSLMQKDLRRSYGILNFVVRNDVGIVTYDDEKFPAPLRKLKNPPVLLYYLGRLPDFNLIFPVSIVGSRQHSDYPAIHTFEIARELALGGTTIVSGMAYGIDGIASAAALSGGGRVIAVIGSGIDVIYPKEHARLSRLIEKQGAIITEYPPGTRPFRTNFPKRNRIIAALGRAVLVTAGKLESGALITAGEARRQGKDLYALPGSVDDPYAAAPSLLLREGAGAVICAEDLLFKYEKDYPHIINLYRLLPGNKINVAYELKKYRVVSLDENNKVRVPLPRDPQYHEGLSELMRDVMTTEGPDTCYPMRDPNISVSDLTEEERELYNRIPEKRGCYMDDLVTSECPIDQVMSLVTNLIVAKLIIEYPGGRIARI